MTEPLATTPEPSLNELIEASRAYKDRLESLNREVSALKDQRDAINLDILARLEEQGLEGAATERTVVSPGERVFASILKDDRATFFAWLLENPHACNLVANSLFADSLMEYEQVYGELPPGTGYHRVATLNMRRK